MAKSSRSKSVPKSLQARYDQIVALTDEVCARHLDTEYGDLAQRAVAALCRKRPSPVASGQPRTWACAVVYALGQVNFLSDRSHEPYMTMAELCAAFGVSQATAGPKAKAVRDALGMHQLDPAWSLRSMADRNPLVWMLEVNGFLVDVRDAPREVQEIAFERGLIPYVPGERE